jgi:alkylhydroperoxidase family enzyme
MTFTLHTSETASPEGRTELEQSVKAFGFVPNLHAVLAEAPNVLKAYKELHTLFQGGSFNNEELTVVWQTINVENECGYCVPAHTGIAHMMKVDGALIDALSKGTELPTAKLQTLKDTTLALLRQRGHLQTGQVEAFTAAGYANQQLLEILLGIAQKTISNYTNHLANTPVDAPFQKFV